MRGTTQDRRICENCAFYTLPLRECRRFPPSQPINSYPAEFMYPTVLPAMFCGEWHISQKKWDELQDDDTT